MGYYTQYELTVTKGDEEVIRQAIAGEYGGYDPFSDVTKWYSWEKDCIYVSSKFPDAEFIIDGVGEEQPDMWRAWFRNGKMKQCSAKITFDEPEWK